MQSHAEILDELSKCIVNFDLDGIRKAAKKAVDAGIPPFVAITEGMSKGMRIIGDRYHRQEVFLSDLIMAAETMKEGMQVLEPYLKKSPGENLGVVVLGTVKGDLHDIGKDIFKTLMISAGFDVHDLGIDVAENTFVEEARKKNANIVGMSALLTVTMPEMSMVINALKEAGIRDNLKTIVGGAAVTEEFARRIGADAYAKDATEGVKMCEQWIESKHVKRRDSPSKGRGRVGARDG